MENLPDSNVRITGTGLCKSASLLGGYISTQTWNELPPSVTFTALLSNCTNAPVKNSAYNDKLDRGTLLPHPHTIIVLDCHSCITHNNVITIKWGWYQSEIFSIFNKLIIRNSHCDTCLRLSDVNDC